MRLFIGIRPTPDFRDALLSVQKHLHAAGIEGRYLDPSNLHLTLAFIGENQNDIAALLPSVNEPFLITLSHIGIFEKAKVLWAGLEPSATLDQLASRVRANLDVAGIPYDHQPFNPHITLVRKPVMPGNSAFPSATALERIHVPHATLTVTEVCLYKSEHLDDGMKYTVIGRV